MKKVSVFILLVLFSSIVYSQASQVTVFSEEGEKFYLILNGEKYNDSPRTNVKATGIMEGSYILKIIFEDKSIGELDKRLMIEPATNTSCVIKKNRKGDYKLRYMGATALTSEDVTPRQPEYTESIQRTEQHNTGVSDPAHQSNIGVSINESSEGVSINMNVNIDENHTSTYSSTTTTTSSMQVDVNSGTQTGEPVQETHYNMPGYSGPIGCPWPMSEEQFIQVQRSIDAKSFEDSKLILAKQVIASNCLLSGQVKRIMELFSFEDTRLELAKYAYGYTYDLGNYYQLNDAFTFESSIEELDAFIMNY